MRSRPRSSTLDLRGDKGAGTVQADKRQLGRALGNMLDNAIAATPEGGRILVALSRTKAGRADRHLGQRPRHEAERAGPRARRLSRQRPTASPDARRSGLGLPLARQLIEAHGGKLELQSEQGAGTTVDDRRCHDRSTCPTLPRWRPSARALPRGCDRAMWWR